MAKRCPEGFITRDAYTATRNGKEIHVPAGCIKATSITGKKRSDITAKQLAARAQSQAQARDMFPAPKCKSGEIVREGYVREGYTRRDGTKVAGTVVSPTCVADRGMPGKGKKLPIVLEKGALTKYGYHAKLPVQERHKILTTIYNAYDQNALSLFRRLDILATFDKNTLPKDAAIFKADAQWVWKTFGHKHIK